MIRPGADYSRFSAQSYGEAVVYHNKCRLTDTGGS